MNKKHCKLQQESEIRISPGFGHSKKKSECLKNGLVSSLDWFWFVHASKRAKRPSLASG